MAFIDQSSFSFDSTIALPSIAKHHEIKDHRTKPWPSTLRSQREGEKQPMGIQELNQHWKGKAKQTLQPAASCLYHLGELIMFLSQCPKLSSLDISPNCLLLVSSSPGDIPRSDLCPRSPKTRTLRNPIVLCIKDFSLKRGHRVKLLPEFSVMIFI